MRSDFIQGHPKSKIFLKPINKVDYKIPIYTPRLRGTPVHSINMK